ncbi:intracellular protein transport protein USO1-like [Nicotiana sylvestris]|uniref:intracellular protein transport protein USO1-like n=1 Tax=Nicotiana sylvestris TaxID=4096 RepID=UPI00388CCB0B
MAGDSELWDIICDGLHVPMKNLEEIGQLVPKGRREYNDIDRKAVEKNYRAKKILMCGIGPDEYNRVSACETAKEIWEALQTAHEGTTQVKQSKIDMFTTEYMLFRMKDDESIQDMHTRFTSIINELHSLGDVIPINKFVRKILSVLSGSWESKTYEMKRKKDSERREPKKEKKLVLKVESNDSSDEDSDMAYLTKRLQKMEQYKQNPDKAGKRNLVPDKRFNRKSVADNIVKQALATWGDSSSEYERESDAENSSIMVVETKATKYDSMFALMAQSDDDDEEDGDDEVNFRDVQRNLKSYSSKKIISLSNVLIDAYYSLVNDKEILTIELGEAEQSTDYLVVCEVDLNETIANLEQEKEALNEKITSMENERDDLIVVVVDLKETIKEERDDLLVICTDLEETIEGLNREHRNVSLGKGKEVASESHILLERELTVVKTSLCSELERNQQLQAELEKVRNDLEKSLKWTWSSDVITAMYLNNSGNKQWMLKNEAEEHHEFLLTESPAERECIFEKEVKGTFSVNEKVERFFRHLSGNKHYVNGLKSAATNLITRQVVSMDKGNKNIHSY